MRIILRFSVCILLTACSTGIDLKTINYGSLFHDGNSKVWMVDQVIVDKKNYAPSRPQEKDVVIFYENGKCSYQPLQSLGSVNGKKGEYSVFSAEKLLVLYFKDAEKWEFDLEKLEENKIVLKPTNNSDLKYTLVLIPLPEI
jgi:hypothetical protein